MPGRRRQFELPQASTPPSSITNGAHSTCKSLCSFNYNRDQPIGMSQENTCIYEALYLAHMLILQPAALHSSSYKHEA